ncbi:Syntaxin-like protein psy1 [Rhodotorula toruloides]|nr:Syntaxin-like protein psy1 [Rhodotorula toruloides]
MSRDRLREARNQQYGQGNAGGYGQPQQPAYGGAVGGGGGAGGYGGGPGYGQTQGSYGGGGYGGYDSQPSAYNQAPAPSAYGAPNSYAPPVGQGDAYAMQPLNGGAGRANGSLIGPDLGPFFAEVESIQDDIKGLHSNINGVSELHSRRLASTDDATQSNTAAQLTQLTNQTTGLTNQIRQRILKLNEANRQSPQGDQGFNTRKLQIANLQNSFKRALEEYNMVEKRSREKYRDRMARQIKIVKPDATDAEIKAAWEDSQGGAQIFSQALVSSRTQGARAAFAEVQSRNQDLRKIEETITQLAQMMQDMATLVLEQDESVKLIETQAVQVNTDVEHGLEQTKKAVKSARRARKMRWACFFIILAIIIVAHCPFPYKPQNVEESRRRDFDASSRTPRCGFRFRSFTARPLCAPAMLAFRLYGALVALLFASAAWAQAQSNVSISVASSPSIDIATRFLETLHLRKPTVFHSFLHMLTEFKIRPKIDFTDPAFAPRAPGLDGRPRPGRYANHNPIFTRLATQNESFVALEHTLLRSRELRERGGYTLFKLALAGGVANDEIREMYRVWEEREMEVEQPAKVRGECVSWIDVAGKKVCSFDEFWKVVGLKENGRWGVIPVVADSPKTYSFDRFFPHDSQNSSLPLVVLYAAPTDEALPELYNALHALAAPASGRPPRLQFAIRWRLDPKLELQSYEPDWRVEAAIKDGYKAPQVESDFSARAVSYIRAAKDKFAALTQVATALPTVASDILATTARKGLPTTSSVPEQLLINGVSVPLDNLTYSGLLDLLDSERQLIYDVAASTVGLYNEDAAKIVRNAALTIEGPRSSAASLAVPTKERPLKFVNLASAMSKLATAFAKNSYIEGVIENETEENDPPAKATVHVVTDLNSEKGRQLVRNALKFAENTAEVRVSFVHNPGPDAEDPHAFSLSTLVAAMVESEDFPEAFPSEIVTFLDFNASPAHPPKRSLNDIWTKENPMTPFVDQGATEAQLAVAEAYWKVARTFCERAGFEPGVSAVLMNGRVIDLPEHEFAVGSFSALHQYELRRRIKPVVEAATAVFPDKIRENRKSQAEVFAAASSIIGVHGVSRQTIGAEKVKGLTQLVHGELSHALFLVTAVLDPLSPFGRTVAPILETIRTMPLFAIKAYLLPSASSTKPDFNVLSGRPFPVETLFDDNNTETVPRVTFAGLPEGAVLDVKVYDGKTGEVLAGPGGQGGETIIVEKDAKEVVYGQVVEVESEEDVKAHVRDEL